ncbi:MAG: hypothetical protein FJ311_14485 [Rhodospirillales bacterium]|nr:hypothetical protein [Rhodospirillales bacterium]
MNTAFASATHLRFIPRGRSRSSPNEPVQPELLAGEAALLAWLEVARSGEWLAYHAGHLALDRARGWSSMGNGVREELGRVADRAMELANRGRLLLAQRRLDDGRITYLAIKPAPGFRPAATCQSR